MINISYFSKISMYTYYIKLAHHSNGNEVDKGMCHMDEKIHKDGNPLRKIGLKRLLVQWLHQVDNITVFIFWVKMADKPPKNYTFMKLSMFAQNNFVLHII